MSKNKNIENWFQQNKERANETPRSELWNRLEEQLEGSVKQEKKRSWMQLVAGVAALLLIAVILMNPFSSTFDNNVALKESKTTNTADENIPKISSVEEEVAIAADTFTSLSKPRSAEVKIEVAEVTQPEIDDVVVDRSKSMGFILDEEATGASPPPLTIPNEEAAVEYRIVTEEEKTIDTETIAESMEDEVLENESDVNEQRDALARSEMAKTSSAGNEKNKQSKVEGFMASGDVARMSGTPASQQGSVNLDWMVGEWTEERSNQTIVESWEKISDEELVGEGYAISNKDTIFYEQLKISSFNGQVILQMQVDEASPPVNFQMVRNDGSVAVFNNYAIEFPNEIVYERQGPNQLNATFRAQSNQDLNDTNVVNSRNKQYLQQRNNISNTEMYRNMKRSGN